MPRAGRAGAGCKGRLPIAVPMTGVQRPSPHSRPSKNPAPLLEGRRIDNAAAARASRGEITYTVVEEPPRRGFGGEKRALPRQRSRLRTGKIITPAGRFMTECLVFDRSESGSRLRLPPAVVVGGAIQFYDDQSAVLRQADVVWRIEREIGIKFRPSVSTPKSRALAADMRRRFYAIMD